VRSVLVEREDRGTLDEVTLRHISLSRENPAFLDGAQMRLLVRDLHRVRAPVYWIDLLLSAGFGWTAFAFAIRLQPLSPAMLVMTAAAALLLYRAVCFMHEISHQNRRTLPGFEAVWNLIVGYPLLMPSFMYVGVHNDHHKLTTYGTSEDPEYLPFARSSRMTVLFALESLFIPIFLLVRFLLASPLGLVLPGIQKWLVIHTSSLTMNVQYRRSLTPPLIASVRRHSAGILLLWTTATALVANRLLPLRVFAVWFAVCAVASFINTLRTLGSHAYESSGEPMDRTGQLLDSIDTPGRFWTELWAPVGLRYHAVHHYFPGIPYHHLPEAYRRFVSTLPISTNYRKMSSPSLQHSLKSLYRKGLQFRR
jgi:fatty acid desaturase